MSLLGRRGCFVLLLAACFFVSACTNNRKVTRANYEQIKEGMSLAEVEQILGKGQRESGGDGSNVAAQAGVAVGGLEGMTPRPKSDVATFVWESGVTKKITIVFVDGKVRSKTEAGL